MNVSLTPLEQTIYIGENATFSCEAEITGREKIGFRILGTEITKEWISQNGASCMHNENTLGCDVSYDEFLVHTFCQYKDPYSIKCNYQIHSMIATGVEPLEVECFIADKYTSDIITSSRSASLFVRCKPVQLIFLF